MSKIICDVCGTSYPETATQCPICGCVSNLDGSTSVGDLRPEETAAEGGYTYVKGGRFSKNNVKKRAKSEMSAAPSGFDADDASENGSGPRKGLYIYIIVAALAIIAVVIYIASRLIAPAPSVPAGTTDSAATTTQSTEQTTEANETTEGTEATEQTQDTTEPTLDRVACEELIISNTSVVLDKTGASILLNVTKNPTDTTDEVVFSSDNEDVAIVTKNGKITAVAGGDAVITVQCGDQKATCSVKCTMEPKAPDESEPEETTEPVTQSNEDFKLNRDDFTLSSKGASHKLYNGSISSNLIKWSSDDEKVATVDSKGVVTAVGAGNTVVRAEYNGVKCTCIVRCTAAVGTATESNDATEGTQTEQSSEPESNTNQNESCIISAEDVSIVVGETFTLTLVTENGDPIQANWSAKNGSICSIQGNLVTGASLGTTTVSAEYNGVTYSCTVRVIVR